MMRKLRVIELYAGIGRTWSAFKKWKRCELALLVDRDELAYDNYTDNFPKTPYWRRDLSFVKTSDLLAHAGGPIDILLGCRTSSLLESAKISSSKWRLATAGLLPLRSTKLVWRPATK
jgi:hypothetical protein